MFADFLSLLIFGESYLFAFEYLLAPALPGSRSREYPDTHKRAEYLAEYARNQLKIEAASYEGAFATQPLPSLREEQFILRSADYVLEVMLPLVFSEAKKIVDPSTIKTPDETTTSKIEKAFLMGVPYDGDASIGDLVNAAWRIFRTAPPDRYASQGRSVVDYVSDLVLKSVEIYELRKYTVA